MVWWLNVSSTPPFSSSIIRCKMLLWWNKPREVSSSYPQRQNMLDLGKINFICPVKTELVGEKLTLMGCSLSGSPWSSGAQGNPCSSTWSISYPVSPWPQSGEGCCSHPLSVGLCLLLNTFHRGCTSSSGDLAVPHSGLALVVHSQGSPTLPWWGSLQSPYCWNWEKDTQNPKILEKCGQNCWMPNSRGTRLLTRFGLGTAAHIWSSWHTGSQLSAVLGAKGSMGWPKGCRAAAETPGVTCPASGGISFWQRDSHWAGF